MPKNDHKLDISIPSTLIQLGMSILSAQGVRARRTSASFSVEQLTAVEDQLLNTLKSNATARTMVGIGTAGLDDPERRLRIRVVAVLACRAMRDSMLLDADVGEVAIAAMDPRLPPAEALLVARHGVGLMIADGILQARHDGPHMWNPRVSLAGRTLLWLSGGNSSMALITPQRLASAGRRGGERKTEGETDERSDPKAFVAKLLRECPSLSPRFLYDELGRRGYVGQEAARRAMALAAFRHVIRLRRTYLDGVAAGKVPRENVLVRGPTGSGKTLLASALFGDILRLPCVVADMTTFTESGYVGDDAVNILVRMVASHGVLGEVGVCVLDEIDKIADAGIGGGRTSVSRHGVQRSLLKLLEPGTVEVPTELGVHPYHCRRVAFNTANLLWVGCGAFSGLQRFARRRKPVGFGADERDLRPDEEAACASDMASYGILPELLGRFPIDIELSPLERHQLRDILDRNVIGQYQKELATSGIALQVESGAIELLVDRAMARGTGARGLQAEMIAALNDAAFEAYSATGRDRMIRLHADGGGVRWDIGKCTASAKVSLEQLVVLAELPMLDVGISGA
jgi:ATP-dependent Clp protease ATP-binding subunit ClpX